MIHVYTGEGKGKTTAAVGLCVRARGAGKRVLLVQFLKGKLSSECLPLEQIGVDIVRTEGVNKFIPEMNNAEREHCQKQCRSCFITAEQAVVSGQYDLVVLDEVFGALEMDMLEIAGLLRLLESPKRHAEIVLTGRNAPQRVCILADYVSIIESGKHPYDKGVSARLGIEY